MRDGGCGSDYVFFAAIICGTGDAARIERG